jgi:hypothetical protein
MSRPPAPEGHSLRHISVKRRGSVEVLVRTTSGNSFVVRFCGPLEQATVSRNNFVKAVRQAKKSLRKRVVSEHSKVRFENSKFLDGEW